MSSSYPSNVNKKYVAHLTNAKLTLPLPLLHVQQLFAFCVSCAVRAAALMNGLLSEPDTWRREATWLPAEESIFHWHNQSHSYWLSLILSSVTRGWFGLNLHRICTAWREGDEEAIGFLGTYIRMSWKFVVQPKPGTETALDACDYFVDDVMEVSCGLGRAICEVSSYLHILILCTRQMPARRCATSSTVNCGPQSQLERNALCACCSKRWAGSGR